MVFTLVLGERAERGGHQKSQKYLLHAIPTINSTQVGKKKKEPRVKGDSRVGGEVKENVSSYFIKIETLKVGNFLSIETMEETTKK